MNMEDNKYEINTLQDILECTNLDNLDNFIKDFSVFLKAYHNTKNLISFLGKEKVDELMKSTKLVWIDDGKHDYTLELQEKPQQDE